MNGPRSDGAKVKRMKKVLVSFWVDSGQKERLEDLSRKNRMLISGYVKEAIEDLLEKYGEPDIGADKRQRIQNGKATGNKERPSCGGPSEELR